MTNRTRNAILLIGAACTLTGCPEGALSEGVTDQPCDSRFCGTTWTTYCNNTPLTLTFISCEIWEATIGGDTLYGYYISQADTITGSTAGYDGDSVCCIIQNKLFRGELDADGRLVVGDCTFDKQ